MSKYLKLFETTSQYQAYISGSDAVLPNVSVAKDAPTTVYYSPWVAPIITYEASAKLTETTTTGVYDSGLHLNAFSGTSGQLTITSHTFENGVGTIEFNGDVTSIGNRAFGGCLDLTSVTIPDSVTSIGESAFRDCICLTSITIPDSVTSLDARTFERCKGLTSITIGSGVKSIGYNAFDDCYFTVNNFVNNSSLNEVANNYWGATIVDTDMNDLVIKNNEVVKYRGTSNSVTIPDSVTSIGNFAFYSTGLTSITSNATTAPTIQSGTFRNVKTGGKLRVPSGSKGYDTWMRTGDYYLGKYGWTKVEQ